MKKIFFLLLLAPLFFGVGCAAVDQEDGLRDLFEGSFKQCQLQPPKGCAGNFSVATREAADVGSNMIRLNGEVMPTDAAVVWWFEYGPNKDKLVYSTEPEVIGGVGPMKVGIYLKKLAPMTPYYYRVVAQNRQGKIHGETYFVTTMDRSCFGAGTWATLSGTAMVAGGFATGSPMLVISGLTTTATGIFDGDFYGDESDARCKEAAGVVGGITGYVAGKSYKKSQQKSPSLPSPGSDGGGGGTEPTGGESGPAMPPTVPESVR